MPFVRTDLWRCSACQAEVLVADVHSGFDDMGLECLYHDRGGFSCGPLAAVPARQRSWDQWAAQELMARRTEIERWQDTARALASAWAVETRRSAAEARELVALYYERAAAPDRGL